MPFSAKFQEAILKLVSMLGLLAVQNTNNLRYGSVDGLTEEAAIGQGRTHVAKEIDVNMTILEFTQVILQAFQYP